MSFYELGHKVSIPYGENCRYDFILDVNGTLLKIQVKTSKFVSEDCFEFSTRSTRVNAKGNYSQTYTKDEIDYFATYWENNVYVVPVEETSSKKTLRFEASLNQPNISWAENYTFERVFEE